MDGFQPAGTAGGGSRRDDDTGVDMMDISRGTLEYLERVVPGNAAVYRLDGERFETLYISPGLPALNGMTMEAYTARCAEDALAMVFPDDRDGLVEAVHACLETDKPLDHYYRVYHAGNGVDWAHVNATVCGRFDGCPVFLAVYTNSSVEADLYQNILDHTNRKVFVFDVADCGILFANRAAREYGKGEGGYPGKKCYQYLHERETRCENCLMLHALAGEDTDSERYNAERDVWEHLSGSLTSWCGRDAFVQYIDDVTESVRQHEKMRNILDAQRCQLEATQALQEPGSIAADLDAALQIVGRYYGADRAYIIETDEGGGTLSNTHEWCREGIDPQIDMLQKVDARYVDRWAPIFHRHEIVVVDDIEAIRLTDPDEYAIMASQGISSYIEAPIFRKGEFCGFIGVDNPSAERLVNTDGLLLSFSYSVAGAISRARADAALGQSQQMYEAAAEMAGLNVWTYDIRNHRITLSDSESTLRDRDVYSIPQVIEDVPRSIRGWVDDDDFGRLEEMYRSLDEGAPTATCEYWYRERPGILRRCERVFCMTVFDDSDAPVFAFGIGMDITAAKLDEERYDNLYAQIVKVNPFSLGTFHLNLTRNICVDGQSLYASVLSQGDEGTVDGYLAANADIIIDDALKREYRTIFTREKLLHAFHEGRTELSLEYPVRSSEGTVIWIDGFVNMVQNPTTHDVEAVTYALNVTERKTEESIVSKITEGEYESIALIDTTAHLFELRKRTSQFEDFQVDVKRDYREMCERFASQWVIPEDRGLFLADSGIDVIVSHLRGGGAYSFMFRCYAEDGRILRKQAQYHWLDSFGRVVVATQSDVTAIYEQEQAQMAELQTALTAAEKANAAKSDFLSRMSHDIRTPLNGIIGMTYLARELDSSPQMSEYLDKIDTSSKFLLGLINDVLDMSKAESGKLELRLEPYDPAAFMSYLDAVIAPLCAEKSQMFSKDVRFAPGVVALLDPLHINQVFFNLLSNAVKYTPEGGTITFRLRQHRLEDGRLANECVVADTGIGMSEDFQKVVFDPFTQENRNDISETRGTGLGLAIVKRIVDAMGGTISIESAIGEGAAVTVRFEADCIGMKRPDDDSGAEASDDYSCLDGVHVLLVEDHPLNQEIARTLLERQGMVVTLAEDGRQAIETFNGSSVGYYDVVLMDIRMPVMDGYDSTRGIRSLRRSDAATVPIIAMTADAFADDVHRCFDAGMDAHIAKPIDPDALYTTILEAIDRTRLNAEPPR